MPTLTRHTWLATLTLFTASSLLGCAEKKAEAKADASSAPKSAAAAPASASAPAKASAAASPPPATPSPSAAPKVATAAPAASVKAPDSAKKSPPTKKRLAVPEAWENFEHATKQFGFWLPQGSATEDLTDNGLDIFRAELPKPTNVEAWIYAYRDKTLTKADLWVDAEAAIKDHLKGTSIQMGPPEDLDEMFAVREATWTENNPVKGVVFVGTDVNDNYVMIVSSLASEYDANRDVIDQVWTNFYLF
ncbi:MAG: hypothetical protein IPM79_04110 [Polyangiaceae bacterium]|nr:hypothetical protein [Polyangiaceae bacterium]